MDDDFDLWMFQPPAHWIFTFENSEVCIPVSFGSTESGSATSGRYSIDCNFVKHIPIEFCNQKPV